MLKNKNIIFLILCISLFIGVYSRIFQAFLSGINNFIFQCSDYGKYLSQTINYTQDNLFLGKIVEFGQEPGWYLIASNIIRITGVTGHAVLISLAGIILILTAILVYVIVQKATKSILWANIGLLTFLISSIQNQSAFFQQRQSLANLFLIILIYLFVSVKTKEMWKRIILWGIFIGGIIISHRLLMGITFLGGGLITIYYLFLKEKSKAISLILALIMGIIMGFPFLWFSRIDYMRTLNWVGSKSESSFAQGAVYTSRGNSFGGYSVIKKGYSDENPLMEYVDFVPLIFIVALRGLRGKKRGHKEMLIFVAMLVIYTYFRLFFSARVIVTLDVLIITIYTIGLCNLSKNKIFSVFIHGVSVLLLVTILSRQGVFKYTYVISKDEPGIQALSNISKDNTIILGFHCFIDIFQQLGFQTSQNGVIQPINELEAAEKNGIFMNWNELWLFGEDYWQFSSYPPFLIPSFLEGKDVYIGFANRFDKKQIELIQSGRLGFSDERYYKTIYSTSDQNSKIRYIYKLVGKEKMYFDSIQHYKHYLLERAGTYK